MFLVKIDKDIHEFIFETKKEALVYIIDSLKRENFDDPIDILKKAEKTSTSDEDVIVTKDKTYVIIKVYGYKTCSICEEAMKACDSLKCKHYVCKDCLLKLRKNECPICRAELKGIMITDEVFCEILQKTEIDEYENENHQQMLAYWAAMGVEVNELYS